MLNLSRRTFTQVMAALATLPFTPDAKSETVQDEIRYREWLWFFRIPKGGEFRSFRQGNYVRTKHPELGYISALITKSEDGRLTLLYRERLP